jgi:hypothetical protein
MSMENCDPKSRTTIVSGCVIGGGNTGAGVRPSRSSAISR